MFLQKRGTGGPPVSSRERGHTARLSPCSDESALRGRIALPGEVSCRMQNTAGGTPALPFEEEATSFFPLTPESEMRILAIVRRELRLGWRVWLFCGARVRPTMNP